MAVDQEVTTTTAGPRWIVLTPSVDHEAWLTALSGTAGDHGCTLEMVAAHADPDAPDLENRWFVTHDAALVDRIDPSRVTVIVPQPETAAQATGALYGIDPPHDAFHASLLLARAMSVGPAARLFSAADLARNAEQIELFKGVYMRPPVAERGSPVPVVAVALGMFRFGRPGVGSQAIWSERLFIFDTRSCIDEAPPGVLDVSGRPRTLVYGPYLALPPGRWKAVMRFSLDEEAATNELRFDWGHAGDFISQTVTAGAPGIYEIEMVHAIMGPAEAWQFRILLMQGAFDGRMTFQGGSVQKLPDAG